MQMQFDSEPFSTSISLTPFQHTPIRVYSLELQRLSLHQNILIFILLLKQNHSWVPSFRGVHSEVDQRYQSRYLSVPPDIRPTIIYIFGTLIWL